MVTETVASSIKIGYKYTTERVQCDNYFE